MHADLSKDLLHQSRSRIEWSGEIQAKKRQDPPVILSEGLCNTGGRQ
jgi:hypothetical protein